MKKEHAVLVTIFLGAIGAQLLTAEHFADVWTPQFLGASMVQLGALVRGFYVPTEPTPKD